MTRGNGGYRDERKNKQSPSTHLQVHLQEEQKNTVVNVSYFLDHVDFPGIIGRYFMELVFLMILKVFLSWDSSRMCLTFCPVMVFKPHILPSHGIQVIENFLEQMHFCHFVRLSNWLNKSNISCTVYKLLAFLTHSIDP